MKIRPKFIILSVLAVLVFIFIFVFGSRNFRVESGVNQNTESDNLIIGGDVNVLSGTTCQNYQNRPMAVILASDTIVRPLSGLSDADMVLEMPVLTANVTRLIALYVCNWPKEIGSIRSARHDFIPLTMGFDAILAHWGGSHYALDELNNHVMDNIDALPNPFNAYYQKKGIPMPHNGFSSLERLYVSAEKLGYRLENKFEGYSFLDKGQSRDLRTAKDARSILKIDYKAPFNVEYRYNSQINSYSRYRGGTPEIDKNNSEQVKAKNIVVMRVVSKQIEGPYYNDLELEGKGDCQVYQNGIIIDCSWRKSEKEPASKLRFLDKSGAEIPFVAGQTWIEIVEPEQEIGWE